DLLALINDILDLSKIESGTVVLDVSELRLTDLQRYVERTFRHIAEAKHVGFEVHLDPELPRSMYTDIKRMQQIIKNLLANAFKFTHEGSVSLTIAPAASGWSPEHEELSAASQVISFAVADTGIGISCDKQQIILEAFQQADGSTSRKYGGTGLGLAISRELSKLLGGEIGLVSAPGAGSTFTLYLPVEFPHGQRARRQTRLAAPLPLPPPPALLTKVESDVEDSSGTVAIVPNEADDDRASIEAGDRVLLIVENDLAFAKVLLEAGRALGMKGIVAGTAAGGLALLAEHKPSVVALDIFLPDMQGWRILDRMKADLSLRHVPVCVLSTDDSRDRALGAGAIAFIDKPVASRATIDRALAEL